jgi:hypothetical protein
MDELTPLKSRSIRSRAVNPLAVLDVDELKQVPRLASNISFSLQERKKALSQEGVGPAAHLCRGGEADFVIFYM